MRKVSIIGIGPLRSIGTKHVHPLSQTSDDDISNDDSFVACTFSPIIGLKECSLSDDTSTTSDNSGIEDDEDNGDALRLSKKKTAPVIGPLMHLQTGTLTKLDALRTVLEEDIYGCDAKWTLFVTAAQSYRYESQLQPFPPLYMNEQSGCKIDSLVDTINDTPKMTVVLQIIHEKNFGALKTNVIDLLHWVLVTLGNVKLRRLRVDELNAKLRLTNDPALSPSPTLVFEVIRFPSANAEINADLRGVKRFNKRVYFGNKLDCFFSIINNGLKQYGGKVQGKPLVLTTSLKSSLNHSPKGMGWGASKCGAVISCVAMCDMAYDPKRVISSGKELQLLDMELVNVRYLLFYGSNFADDHNKKKKSSKHRGLAFNWTAFTYAVALAVIIYLSAKETNNMQSFMESIGIELMAHRCWNIFRRLLGFSSIM